MHAQGLAHVQCMHWNPPQILVKVPQACRWPFKCVHQEWRNGLHKTLATNEKCSVTTSSQHLLTGRPYRLFSAFSDRIMADNNSSKAIFGGEKNDNHKQLFRISQNWVGVNFVYVLPVSWGKRDTHQQNSQEISGQSRDSPGIIPGQSREMFCFCFSLFIFFRP